ncbi:MAG: DUF1080 domain-containing protein [Candidatus Sumerlaeota bacterium]|nr:DUF1080 domain-containing protein [Candidatus Sumerlaeota bacterium]
MIRKALFVTMLAANLSAFAADNPFIGHWALTIPGGGAGWMGVEEKDGKLQGSVLWGGGSVLPVTTTKVEGDKLVVTRVSSNPKKDAAGKVVKDAAGKDVIEKITETITATLSGDNLKLVTVKDKGDGKEFGRAEFNGKRIPPVPPAPDLSKVKYGEPIQLFNGKDLTGWKLLDPKADNGWSVKDGVLINRVEKGKHCGNLRTEKEFEDFNLKLEVRTQKGSNSGVYLRGIYEIQIAESYGKPLDPHNMCALYSRIKPTVAAEKPIDEWQTLDITLVDRHLTVILNGKTIIDNQPVLGCTGGALTSDEFKPGPIYLQGDHTNIDYRNIVLTPVIKVLK